MGYGKAAGECGSRVVSHNAGACCASNTNIIEEVANFGGYSLVEGACCGARCRHSAYGKEVMNGSIPRYFKEILRRGGRKISSNKERLPGGSGIDPHIVEEFKDDVAAASGTGSIRAADD